MLNRYLVFGLLSLLLMLSWPALAQEDDDASTDPDGCTELVEAALARAADACDDLGRNTACYGNGLIVTERRDADVRFDDVGDVADVADLTLIQTTALDLEAATWGVGVLNLQANLPDTQPGQNVRFLIYGDTTIEDVTEPDAPVPMQAMVITGGVGQPQCQAAPESGVLVQSPQGITVTFEVNGVLISMGSTALLQEREGVLRVANVSGSVAVTVDDVSVALAPGEAIDVPTGTPGEDLADLKPVVSEAAMSESLPLDLLPDPVARPIVVPANVTWVDSGVALTAGQAFSVVAGGQANWAVPCEELVAGGMRLPFDCAETIAGPGGSSLFPGELGAPQGTGGFPLPNAAAGLLVGRVGDGVPFAVGAGGDFVADQGGTLQFQINDDVVEDNAGAFTITVTVAVPAADTEDTTAEPAPPGQDDDANDEADDADDDADDDANDEADDGDDDADDD